MNHLLSSYFIVFPAQYPLLLSFILSPSSSLSFPYLLRDSSSPVIYSIIIPTHHSPQLSQVLTWNTVAPQWSKMGEQYRLRYTRHKPPLDDTTNCFFSLIVLLLPRLHAQCIRLYCRVSSGLHRAASKGAAAWLHSAMTCAIKHKLITVSSLATKPKAGNLSLHGKRHFPSQVGKVAHEYQWIIGLYTCQYTLMNKCMN